MQDNNMVHKMIPKGSLSEVKVIVGSLSTSLPKNALICHIELTKMLHYAASRFFVTPVH